MLPPALGEQLVEPWRSPAALHRHQHHRGILEPHGIPVAAGVDAHAVAVDRAVDHRPQQRAVVVRRDRPWRRGARARPARRRSASRARAGRPRGRGPCRNAERTELDRGGVAVPLHGVEGGGLGRIVGRHRIAQHDAAAGAADPDHLGEGARRLLQVMEGEAAADDVERRRPQRAARRRRPGARPRSRPSRRLRACAPRPAWPRWRRGPRPGAHAARRRRRRSPARRRHRGRRRPARGAAASTSRSSAAWLCSAGRAANCSAWRVNWSAMVAACAAVVAFAVIGQDSEKPEPFTSWPHLLRPSNPMARICRAVRGIGWPGLKPGHDVCGEDGPKHSPARAAARAWRAAC